MKLKKINNYINYAFDFFLVYGFIAIVVSSYILWFVLSMGKGFGADISTGHSLCDKPLTGQGHLGNAIDVFNWTRWQWVDFHSWISVMVVAVILIHLIWHWQWIVESIRRFKVFFLKHQKAVLERYVAAFILFILTAFETLSGIVIWLIMPRGVGDLFPAQAGYGRTFWGLQRNVWVDLHAWVAVFMIAIIVVHVIIHWRWIVNKTIGRTRAVKDKGIEDCQKIYLSNKPNSQDNTDTPYLPRLGMLTGLIGAICFLVAMLTFGLDQAGRYDYMFYLIPIPFIIILLARHFSLVGGLLLIVLGVLTPLLYILFPIGITWNTIGVWNTFGLETLYTIVFVSLPLLISGISYLVSTISHYRIN
jgi:hypothetical protein